MILTLKDREKITRKALDRASEIVQWQHSLPRTDPLKCSYDQMTILFDRLDEARLAHDAAYAAMWEEVCNADK